MSHAELFDAVQFDARGLAPVVVQEEATGEVLMLAYMNAEALRRTLETGRMTYWSRSRRRLWTKGETSGRTQQVCRVQVDCDGDALLFTVHQRGGAACHTGHRTCFYRTYQDSALQVQDPPVFEPDEVYHHSH